MSQILVLSDIHANLTALDAVLNAAGTVDAIWCLGDVVGYGPDPNECIERLRGLPNLTCLVGNHDAAALDHIELDAFNREARHSVRWTKSVLTEQNREFLGQLPERTLVDGITLVHGSPRSPVWEYLLDQKTVSENMSYFDTDLCFIGHTHIPLFFCEDSETGDISGDIIMEGDCPEICGRMFLNPGSVGQPRDRDSRAAYAIFNLETRVWKAYRVRYDIASVQNRMRQADLPTRLVQRLLQGW
jgi:diadenosine tetraphosphatase ApaH/serine/threonine PP2A family protein phosphatase